MPTTFNVSVSIKESVSGQEIFGAPLTASITVDEHTGVMRYDRVTGGGYVAIPTSILDEVQILVLRPTQQQMTFRLDGQTDAGLVINTNGFLVAVNVDIDAAAATNVTGENASGSTTVLEAFAGGT